MLTPEQQCMRIVRRAHSNFSFAFRSLSRDAQRAIRALYAFCRVIDDIADEPQPAPDQHAAILRWREWLADGLRVDDPVAREVAWAQARFGLPAAHFTELLDGVTWDLEGRAPQSWQELEQYCYGVAGTVGLLCLPIFGVSYTPVTTESAIVLGRAFQLTNIARDIGSDARAGRCYIPRDCLATHALSLTTVTSAAAGDLDAQRRLLPVLRDVLERAQAAYQEAWRGFPVADCPQMEPARLMSYCYYSLLQQMTQNPARVFSERVALGPVAKVRVGWRALTGCGCRNLWFM